MGKVIDGKKIAEQIREDLKVKALSLKDEGRAPGLAVVMVGDNPASRTYVRMKEKAAEKLGVYSRVDHLKKEVPETELLELIDKLNNDKKIDGILVQLPLPEHINTERVIEAIKPEKDVDGFHPLNTGRLFSGQQTSLRFEACTPLGIMKLIKIGRAYV